MTNSKIDIVSTMRGYRSDMNNILNQYYNKSDQVTTGQKYKYYSDLTSVGKTNFKITNENNLETARNLILTNSLEFREMEAMSDQLQFLYNLNEEMARQIIERKTPLGYLRNLSQITKSSLESIKSSLETKFSGKSIFFGGNSRASEIGDIVNKSNVISGQITANYSVGDSYRKTIMHSEGNVLEYGILDHDEAFQKMIAYHHYILEFEQTNELKTLDKAFQLYQETKQDLSVMMSKLGTKMKTVEDAQNRYTDIERYTQEVLETQLKPNTAELVAEINELQYVLNASYKIFGMATKNTNLADYI